MEGGVSVTSIISKKLSDENQLETTVDQFFQKYKIASMLRHCNFSKQMGTSCSVILQCLFLLVFTGKNWWQTLQQQGATPFAKDCVYRFLNSYNYNWRKLLLMLTSSAIREHIFPLTSEDRVNVFVIDDSLYSRSRSKSVELLARVRDHVENRKITVKKWMIIPVNFS